MVYSDAKHWDVLRGSVMFVVICSKYKIITVVASEPEHTVMSTLQYVHAYLYVSWFLFFFKDEVMSNYYVSLVIMEIEIIAWACWDM